MRAAFGALDLRAPAATLASIWLRRATSREIRKEYDRRARNHSFSGFAALAAAMTHASSAETAFLDQAPYDLTETVREVNAIGASAAFIDTYGYTGLADQTSRRN